MSKIEYFLKVFLTRGIIPIICYLTYISIKDSSINIIYYGLGNLAILLGLSIIVFPFVTFFLYLIEGVIIPAFTEGIGSILLFIVCAIIVCFRAYAMGHLFDSIPGLISALSFTSLVVILERIMGLRNQDYNW